MEEGCLEYIGMSKVSCRFDLTSLLELQIHCEGLEKMVCKTYLRRTQAGPSRTFGGTKNEGSCFSDPVLFDMCLRLFDPDRV